MQVEEMALNNIVLQQANGIKVFYPITRMFTEPLYNVTRSSNRWEGFRVSSRPSAWHPQSAYIPCLPIRHDVMHTQLKGEAKSLTA